MYQPIPTARARAPSPQATPIPAAAPELRPDELCCDDACTGGAVAVDEADELVPSSGWEPVEVAEVVVAIVVPVCDVEIEANAVVEAELVVDELNVAVSNNSRFNAMLCPADASGWLSQADCMVSRTVFCQQAVCESRSGILQFPSTTDPSYDCRHLAQVLA
jgi:hypothetical protein